MLSDGDDQLVTAEEELRFMTEGWNIQQLKDLCAKRGMKWKFTTPAVAHQNGCTEALNLDLVLWTLFPITLLRYK